MSKCCVAAGCRNHNMMAKKLSFYRFPQDLVRFNLWIEALRKNYPDGNQWQPTKNSRICSEHFITGKPNDDPNHTDYVPSIFAFDTANTDPGTDAQQEEIDNGATKRKTQFDAPVGPKLVKTVTCSLPLPVSDENWTEDLRLPKKKTHYYCVVPGCISQMPVRRNGSVEETPLKFYPFPSWTKKRKDCQVWLDFVNCKDFHPGRKHRICSRHFVDGQPTAANPYPTQFPHETEELWESSPPSECENDADTKENIVDKQENESDATLDPIHEDMDLDLILECTTVDEEDLILECTTVDEECITVDENKTDTEEEQVEDETYMYEPSDLAIALFGFANDHNYIGTVETEKMLHLENNFIVAKEEVIEPEDYMKLKIDTSQMLVPKNFVFNTSSSLIQFLEFYQGRNIALKLVITIQEDFRPTLHVHRREINQDHYVWKDIPKEYRTIHDISVLLLKVMCFFVCIGNPDPEFQDLLSLDSESPSSIENVAYRDGYYNEATGIYIENSTVRSIKCSLLVNSNRCKPCCVLRKKLLSRKIRKEKRDFNMKHKNLAHYQTKHKDMSREMLIAKIGHQKDQIKTLQSDIGILERHYKKLYASIKTTSLDKKDAELSELMASLEWKVMKVFPEDCSKQRMFWEQQCKAECSKKTGIKWNPSILKWCLNIMSISKEAFEFIRESGVFRLPSARTLFQHKCDPKKAEELSNLSD